MKEIFEIDVMSTDHLTPAHIKSCSNEHMFGNYNYNIKGKAKIRNFATSDGKYNRDGKFLTVPAFNKINRNRVQACYDEVIEVQIELIRL